MKFKLTWHEARKCWKKFSDGKTYYLGKGKCKAKYDTAGYNAALKEWDKISGELKAKEKVEEIMESDEVVLDLIERAASNRRRWDIEYPTKTYDQAREMEAALEEYRRSHVEIPPEQTVKAHSESFLKFKTAQVAADQKSAGRLRNIRTYLNRFNAFVGIDNPIKSITATTLANFHAQLLTDVAHGTISDYAARDAMQIARQFIRRLWEHRVIDLPNNIDSQDLEIQVHAKAIEIWDFPVLAGVLKSAPEPLRLYLLLMANCGMTQKDVSDLLPSEMDWKQGIITRKRSKTKKWESVPTVSYRLWKPTFDLLKKHGKREGLRVLSAPGGTALVIDALTKNEKNSKSDKINEAWNDWVNEQKLQHNKGLAAIRKTSSSKLGEKANHARFAQFFLAQSAKTVADKHYVLPSQTEFDKAVTWLGKQYGY